MTFITQKELYCQFVKKTHFLFYFLVLLGKKKKEAGLWFPEYKIFNGKGLPHSKQNSPRKNLQKQKHILQKKTLSD